MNKTTVGGKTFYLGTGRRKTSVAQVRICEGTGKFVVNHRSVEEFFTEEKDRGAVTAPLNLLDMRTRIDVRVNVHGGGITGQAGGILQGLARALKVMFSPPPGSETAEGETVESGIIKKLRRFRLFDSR